MKTLYLVVLLLFAQTATAQEKSSNTSPPDLIIIKYQIGSVVQVDVSRTAHPPKIDESHQFEDDPHHYESRVKAELQVQNSGSKRIKRIDWRLLLIVGENSTKQIYSYGIHSNKTIRPGEKVTLAGWIRNQSINVISKQRKKGLAKERVDITRIEYADGSIWEGDQPLKTPLTN